MPIHTVRDGLQAIVTGLAGVVGRAEDPSVENKVEELFPAVQRFLCGS